MTTDSLRERAERILALRRAATPGPWCWEQCGEKCDAPVVGIAYHPDDTEASNPISGELICIDANGREVDCYRESIAADISSVDGCSAAANAAFIATIHEACDLLALLRDECAALRATLQELVAVRDARCELGLHQHGDWAARSDAAWEAARATGAESR